MNWKVVLKIICLTVIAVPELIASIQGIEISPMTSLVIAVLSFAAGMTLSELSPGISSGSSRTTSRRPYSQVRDP